MLSSDEAHVINRMMDEPPKTDPLRRFVSLYRFGSAGVHLGHRAFETQVEAWTKPSGPNVPRDLEILDVIEVRAEPR